MRRLQEFFDQERQRVFLPDAYFVQRVISRFNQKVEDLGIWATVPTSSRAVLVLALVVVLCFLALDEFVPVMPDQGIVDAFLESEQGPVDSRVLSGTEDAGHEFIEELIAMEGEQ
jgi:cell division protein ZapA (FtsZ GTPase activity inhibitor)